MVANADLLENVHHVKLDPFFDDLSSFDEDDVYVSDGNSLSCGRNALILSCVGVMHCYAVRDNCVRPHQSLGGKTPAQAARMEVPNNWKGLIDQGIKQEAEILARSVKQKEENQELKVISK